MKFFEALGRFDVRFRWFVLVVWLVAAFACIHFLPSISSVSQGNNTTLLPKNAPSEKALRLAAPLEGGAQVSAITVVAAPAHGKLTKADEAAIGQAATALAKVPKVQIVRNLGVAPSGRAAQLSVGAKIAVFNNVSQEHLVSRLDAALDGVRAPPGLHFYLTGQIPTNVANTKSNKKTSKDIESFSILFILVLLFLVFRSLLAPLLTLLPAMLVAGMSGPVIAEAAKAGVPVSELTQFMLIVIVLGAGTDYGLFLVFRTREELRRGLAPHDAVIRALGRVGESITFSAATVIAAFLTLLVATFGVYESLGPPLAIAIALMLLAGLTLLPALLAIFGRAAFWPSRVKPLESGEEPHRLWGRVSASVVQRPAVTLLVGVVVLGGFAIASLGNKPAGFGGAVSAPKGSEAAKGAAILAANYPSAFANPTDLVFRYPVSVWNDPNPLVIAGERLGADKQLFSSLIGPLDPNGVGISPAQLVELHKLLGPASALPAVRPLDSPIPADLYDAYRATGDLISRGGHTVQFEANLAAGAPSSTAAMDAIPAIRAATAAAAKASGASAWGVGGEAAGLYDVNQVSSSDLAHVLPIAIIAIGLLLGLVLRSLVAPWYLVASVAFSYIAALGIAVVVFIDIGGASGLTFILPFLLFLFLLALGEDYNILVLTRIREESHTKPLKQAVKDAVGITGTTVTSAGLVLAGTFAVLAFAGGSGPGASQIRDVGFGLAIGILVDTFVVRTLLVPSAVVLIGKWSWWPSKLYKLHAQLEPAGDGAAPAVVGGTPGVSAAPAAVGGTPGVGAAPGVDGVRPGALTDHSATSVAPEWGEKR